MNVALGRRDAAAMTILGLIGVGIPLWLAVAAGAIGIPTVDDWVYMRGASSLFSTGSIDMPGHTAASVGQLLMVQPFLALADGASWAFTAFGLAMTFLAVETTYLLARRFLGAGSAATVVLLVVAFPGFARISASFMTDVPSYALATLCLLFGSISLEDRRRWPLFASLGFGLVAVSIREFALAAPVAVLVVAWVRSDASDRGLLAGASAAFAVGVGAVLFAASLIPGHAVPETSGGIGRVVLVIPAAITVAAVLLPVLVLAVGQQLEALRPATILAGVGVASLSFVAPWGTWTGGGGNFWTPFGLAGDGLLRGAREIVIGGGAWAMSAQIAWIAGMLLATAAIHWVYGEFFRSKGLRGLRGRLDVFTRSRVGLIATFVIIYSAGLLSFAAVYGVWDRYLYPLTPALAILLLAWRPSELRFGRSVAFAHASMAWLTASAFVIAANSFAYDAARWREGEAGVARGYDVLTIDAGYEWVGYHAKGSGGQGYGDRGQAWFEHLMSPAPICAILSNSLPDYSEPLLDKGLRPLDSSDALIHANPTAYRQYLFFGEAQPLYLYGARAPGCPVPRGS